MNLLIVKNALLEIESILNSSSFSERNEAIGKRIIDALRLIRSVIPSDRIIAMNLAAIEGRARELAIDENNWTFAKNEILRMCSRLRSVLPRT